jgi:hypothetical protein
MFSRLKGWVWAWVPYHMNGRPRSEQQFKLKPRDPEGGGCAYFEVGRPFGVPECKQATRGTRHSAGVPYRWIKAKENLGDGRGRGIAQAFHKKALVNFRATSNRSHKYPTVV